MAGEDSIVLDYHNSLLRLSDYELLDPPNWINDKIIEFCFEYFEREKYRYCADLIAFISPSVIQAIKFYPQQEMGIFLDPLNLSTKDFVFMAINDNMAAYQYGGSHWSLLMYNGHKNEFCHYDSMSSSNMSIAEELCKKLQVNMKGEKMAIFKEMNCPQQENGYDCGVHVIATCEHLVRQNIEAFSVPLEDCISTKKIRATRQEIKDLICSLKTAS
ncbi:sentrin-specific protease 8-like [Argonauta hians]